ncbi:MAG: protein-L-isoaspartate(D-aspartate) O-methyltransferase [Elusimicrobiales bacterium]|nr:protein-L-isoaspartate(D-aspartate) O-methyltransferase [Elusimicrobiales bacterium]
MVDDDIIKKLGEKYQKYFEYLNQKMITEQIIRRGIDDSRIIDAIKTTPRHIFVPDNLKTRSYDDSALEILPGQTISQPYVVALMIKLLNLNNTHKILEIGTGTGWQTTILSKIAKEVYSIDIKDTLFEYSKKRIELYSNGNVRLKIDDGFNGWKEFMPFDRIIVSCASNEIPKPLIDQLSNDGIMVIPVGPSYHQTLKVIEKNKNEIKITDSIDVIFVKMERKSEYREIDKNSK